MRVCFCDRYECPADCDKCDAENNSPCNHHQLIKCASPSCRQHFHRCCIESIGFIQTEGYTCLKCTSNQDTENNTPWNNASLQAKAERFGLLTPLNEFHQHHVLSGENAPKEIVKQIQTDTNKAVKAFV